MKRTVSLIFLPALLVASCGKNTVIEGTLTGMADSPVVVKLLDIGRYQVLDTVRTDRTGAYTYTRDIPEGQPELLYLFSGNRKIASLLASRGDHIRVVSDTLGNYTVEGSEESLLLQQAEQDYAQFLTDLDRISAREEGARLSEDLSRRYVEYYRRSITYVMTHTKSLTVVPVLFQEMKGGLPVFSQPTDAVLFRTVCDSLQEVYPASRYVKALDREARRRQSAMTLEMRLREAEEIGFFDIELPSTDATPVRLSNLGAKVVMLYFWSATAEQKMFNLDALIPLYEEFHGRGFEIYAVSLDADKTAWATTVRAQRLPWINVCDIRGAQSPYVGMYGVSSVPMAWMIVDGTIDASAHVTDAASIRKYLQTKLK